MSRLFVLLFAEGDITELGLFLASLALIAALILEFAR